MCAHINYKSSVVLITKDDYQENISINNNYNMDDISINYTIKNDLMTFQENCFYTIGSIISLILIIYLSNKIYYHC